MTRLRKSLLLVLVNLALLSFLLEVGAYVVYPRMFGESLSKSALRDRLDAAISGTDPDAAYQSANWMARKAIHPYMGFTIRPGTTPEGDRSFFAEPHTRFEPSDDRVVVALSGGSVAATLHKHVGDVLESGLESLPAFAGREVVVQRFAMGGFKQPQQLMALVFSLVQGEHFDYWINLDGFNEIALPVTENVPRGVAVSYPRAWPAFALAANDQQQLSVRIALREIAESRDRYRSLASLPVVRSSAFCLMMWRWLDGRSVARGRQLVEELNAQLQKGSSMPEHLSGPQPIPGSRDEALREAVRVWYVSSVQMATICRAFGIRYFHFLQPNQYVPGSKVFTEEEREIALGPEGNPYQVVVEDGYPLLARGGRELSQLGISFHSLERIFANTAEATYTDTCCHPNDFGYEILAKEIVRIIDNETRTRVDTDDRSL